MATALWPHMATKYGENKVLQSICPSIYDIWGTSNVTQLDRPRRDQRLILGDQELKAVS